MSPHLAARLTSGEGGGDKVGKDEHLNTYHTLKHLQIPTDETVVNAIADRIRANALSYPQTSAHMYVETAGGETLSRQILSSFVGDIKDIN